MPTFSILIPAYQAAETIGATVESALAQTAPAHEIFVIDDGSTDPLERALAPYRERIELIRKANGGGASALNAGAAAATGEFVAVLDADDLYHPRRLEALGALAAARPDLDIVTTDAYFVIDGRRVGRFNAANPFAVEDQRVAILRSAFFGGWPAVRRSRLQRVDGWDEEVSVAYDWDCWIRLLLDGATVGLVDLPYLEYRIGGAGLTSDRVGSLEDRVAILEKASANPMLRPQEREPLARSIRHHRERVAIARAEELARSEHGLRSRLALIRAALQPGLTPATRARLALLSVRCDERLRQSR